MDKDDDRGKNAGASLIRRIAYFVVVAVVLIAAVLLGYQGITYATGESNPFTVVTGTSMEPTILAGTVAVISKVPFDHLKIGDVIVFTPQVALLQHCDSTPGGSLTAETAVPCFVIHRIVSISFTNDGQRYLTTKGDDNQASLPFYDTNITSSMYIGKVILQIPLLGYLTESPYNEYAAGIILLVLVGQFLWERRSSERKPEMKQMNPA